MHRSKLTSRNRTTLPKKVCAALELRDGDMLAYTIESNGVLRTKLSAMPESIFCEWATEADNRAFGKL